MSFDACTPIARTPRLEAAAVVAASPAWAPRSDGVGGQDAAALPLAGAHAEAVAGRRRYDVSGLMQSGRWSEAADLLAQHIATAEREVAARLAARPGRSDRLAPQSYIQLATVRRKQRRYEDEIAVCDRYLSHPAGGANRALALRSARAELLIRRTLI